MYFIYTKIVKKEGKHMEISLYTHVYNDIWHARYYKLGSDIDGQVPHRPNI